MYDVNLSEELFKPHFDYVETSLISNSGSPLPTLSKNDFALGFGFDPSFYRPIHKFLWVIGGGNLLDIDEALANISKGIGKRSRESCLDTISEYGPGNWIYEFCTIAQRRVNNAHQALETNDLNKACHNFRMASRYFAIAAYPNLKGDVLALNADVLCRKYYKQMYQIDPNSHPLVEESFLVDGKKVTGYLHLPTTDKVLPCVIAVCPYENSITSYYQLFNNYFKQRNIAMFVLEMPGIGACSKLNLDDHYSDFVEKAIEHVASLKYIDSTKIALIGSELSAATCIRASALSEIKVKAQVLTRPFVHSIFTNIDYLNAIPLCLRSSFCNRLNLDAKNWDILLPRFRSFSLKEQGILSSSNKNTTPTLICSVKNSSVSATDIELLEHNFKDISIYTHENKGYAVFAKDALGQMIAFLDEKLNS